MCVCVGGTWCDLPPPLIPRDGQVTAFGTLGLDMAWAPNVPMMRVPLMLGVGAMTDKVVVEGKAAVIRPMLSLFATIDHRYIDGSDGARLCAVVRAVMSDPKALEARSVAAAGRK